MHHINPEGGGIESPTAGLHRFFFREDKEREGNKKREMESGSLILRIDFKVDVGTSKNIVKN